MQSQPYSTHPKAYLVGLFEDKIFVQSTDSEFKQCQKTFNHVNNSRGDGLRVSQVCCPLMCAHHQCFVL